MSRTFVRRVLILLGLLATIAWLSQSGWFSSHPPAPPDISRVAVPEADGTTANATIATVARGDDDDKAAADDHPGSAALPLDPGHVPSPDPTGLIPVAARKDDQPKPSTREFAAGGTTVAAILKDVDMTDPEARARVVARMRLLDEHQNNAVVKKARLLGVPIRKEGPDHKVSILYDFRGGEPLYRTTLNANAAISSGANLLAPMPYSLTGSGVKVAIWDGGSVRSTHQELAGRVVKIDSSAPADDHATHVAGTIGASGVRPAAKGMSPQINIDSYDWTSDYAEMTSAAAASAGDTTHIPLSNHSYGYDAVTADMGRYETEASSVDAVAASLPYYLPFWAAGNEQDTLTAKSGYQSVTFNALAKNIMTIGAVDDAVAAGVRNPTAGVIAYFSSLGPCDDGRIKPDVVANGVNLYSSIATGDAAYDGTYSGTSMATPNAMGSAALLVQLYAREFSGQRMRASTLKALLIHTADDVGMPGPDYKYGWGLINVKAAAGLIVAHKASLAAPKMIEGVITDASAPKTHTFSWDGVSPIRATLCWTDPVGAVQSAADSRTPNLKHNLDAKITAPDGTTIYQPFVMPFVGNWSTASMSSAAIRGKNNVDTVEQVYLADPSQTGNYTITVSLDGSLTTGSQIYSLIVTGGTDVETNPPPTVALISPANGAGYLPGKPVTVSASASDLAIGGAPGSVARVEFFDGSRSLGVDVTPPYSVDWTPAAAGSYSLTAKATDNEGAAATSAAVSITVLTGDGVPVVSSITPASGAAGSLVVLTGLNFVNVSAVKFNGQNAAFTVESAGLITATVPALATTGTIAVVTSYGTGTSANPFTVLQSPVLISQIYGAGGNSGAIYRRDYVELYNRSAATVSLAGWSVQYASASGTTWGVAALTGSIAPGKYCLVGLASGTSGLALPSVDVSGSLAMSASSGKIALLNTSTAVSGSSPVGTAGLQDFVGYGSANASEGAAAPTPSTTTAIFRANGGATDTGNNSTDFSAATPNPRNSASGPAVVPVITSAVAAGGTVGSSFYYQIGASNAPTSYAAGGLPSGLVVNTSTGVISGIPSAAGTSTCTISASNTAGTGSAALTISITSGGGGATTELLREEFVSIVNGDNVTTTGASTAWPGNSNFPAVSSAYQAGGVVKLGSSGSTGSITSKTLDLSGNGGVFNISFKVKGWTTVEGSIKVTVTGLSSQTVSYTSVMAGTFETKMLAFTGGTPNSTVKFETTAKRAYLDDIVVFHASAPVPAITATGSLIAADSIYGSASADPAEFVVSGANMTAAIWVTPPAGFEVSQTPGGAAGYAPTQIITGTGTIAATVVYVRLAAGTTAGTYSGNIACSSAGAATVIVATAPSEVRPKLLTITANDLTKPFGHALTLGAGRTSFTSSGLVGADSIGSVTLVAAGGTGATDAPGHYTITPSAATGGNFDPNNYDPDYIAGTLTVSPLSYSAWLADHPGLAEQAADADPDGDGLTNLMEYFMGLDPETAGTNRGVTASTDGSALSMTYRHAKGIAGVNGTVKWSNDLGVWNSDGVSETAEDMGTYELRTAIVPRTAEEPRKFMRLEVSQP